MYKRQRLPSADARNNVLQFDLKTIGITDYGTIYPSGHVPVNYYENAEGPDAPELFVNGSRMTLARYPNEGSVSYTHLDVYKRQAYCSLKVNDWQRLI